jgi:cytoskeletal protein CcmA (bactofilin family)
MPWKLLQKLESDDEGWTGFVEHGVHIEGKLHLPGTFRIDGRVKGIISSERTLFLGENANVEGQIEGGSIVIHGTFEGLLVARERVEIGPKGFLKGEVRTPCLIVDPGGACEGECHVLRSEVPDVPLRVSMRRRGQDGPPAA